MTSPVTSLYKVYCATPSLSGKFQRAAFLRENITWGEQVDALPWNCQRQWLIVQHSTLTNRMFITWATERDYERCSAPGIRAIEYVNNKEFKMAERINCVKHDIAGVLLINAMTAATKRGDLLAMYAPVEGTVEVELKINGHVVPFVETVEDAWGRLVKDFDKRALKKAMEMIEQQGFGNIEELIAGVRSDLVEKLREAFPQIEVDRERY